MRLEDYKKESLRSSYFRKEYKKQSFEEEIAYMIRESRVKRGLTQEELAEKMGTKQTSVSRVENEKCLPGLKFLKKWLKY